MKKFLSILLSSLMTVSCLGFTGTFTSSAQDYSLTPITTNTDWAGQQAQRCTMETITDEFGRKINRYYPDNQYYDGGDKTATGVVAPGGTVPAAGKNTNYKVFKLVYRSDITTVPTLVAFKADNSSTRVNCTSGETSLAAGEWHTVYYNYGSAINAPMAMYMVRFTTDDVANHMNKGEEYEIGYTGIFGSLEDAQRHVSPFEGDFTITDVLFDGTSIGNVTNYDYDLDGRATIPELTIKATGKQANVVITNGILSEDGTATSKVTVDGVDKVTVNFSGGSLDFVITDILLNGKSLEGFSKTVYDYEVQLPYASKSPKVTYTYDGLKKEVEIETVTTGNDHVTTISYNGEVVYTINFEVDDEKPTALLNTLYKLQKGEQVTVGYFGGSVTGGTGASVGENYSWRALTRNWIIDTFNPVNKNIVERKASVGGTGSVYGVYRADRHLIMDKAPDLCFIEMAVNDGYDGIVIGSNANYIYAESIVKKIYASNPKADIIFIITGDHGNLRVDVGQPEPYYGYVYTNLGKHYNIPCLYVGRELALYIKENNNGIYPSSSSDPVWLQYYNDIVHPTDLGYAHYAATIIDYLRTNLPVDYVPTAAEYKDKVLPTDTYCELNNKGELIVDAYTVAGNEIKSEDGNAIANGNSALGGYYHSTYSTYYPLMSNTKDAVVSLKFKASTIGAWVWAYSNTGGTNITYSIDGGEKKTKNFYLGSANHQYIFFGQGLDPEKEHVLRIYHNDSNTLDIRYFFLSGLSKNITTDEMGVTALSPANPMEKDKKGNYVFDVKVKKADGSDIDVAFNPAKSNYAVVVTDRDVENGYPTIEVTVPEGYYSYEVTQATSETKKAIFSLDNSKVFTFNFMSQSEADEFDDTEYIKVIKTPAKKLWGIVEGQTVTAPEATETETDIYGINLTPVWAGADGFNFGDKAVGNELIAYTATYTVPEGLKFDASLEKKIENSVISEDGRTFTIKLYTYVIPKDAIYVDDNGQDSTDNANGSLDNPYKTLDYAMQQLEKNGGGVIVIKDKITATPRNGTSRTGHYTIMGWDAESAIEDTKNYWLRANTTFRDINLIFTGSIGLSANGYALTLGDKNYTDIIVTGSGGKNIFMTGDGGTFRNPGKLIINSGTFATVATSGYNNTKIPTGTVEYEINGGTIDKLNLGLQSSAIDKGIHSISGNISATINGGTIGTLNLGSSDKYYRHDGNCNVTINGGTIGDIIFTSTKSGTYEEITYPIQSGDYTLTINGGTITGKITDTSANGVGVSGKTTVDISSYNGNKAELKSKITTSQFDEINDGSYVAISADFVITHPIAELTPVSNIILNGETAANYTASAVTWEPAATKFEVDTQYTATVTLTALDGIEFTQDLSGIIINGGNANNTIEKVLSEDKTQVTVKVTFPKTDKAYLNAIKENVCEVDILFTTVRAGADEEYFRGTTVTLTNLTDDSLSTYGVATENGTNGSFTAAVCGGVYDITVKKNGYVERKLEGVLIENEQHFFDLGRLIPGDIIGANGETAGDGVVDVDDFIITIRGFTEGASDELIKAADINETGIINVNQLGYVKTNFGKNTKDSTNYNGLFQNTYYKLTVNKKLNVGYIGTSIIQSAGPESAGDTKYIDRMHKWFEENFAEAEINSINAGVSSLADFSLEENLKGYIPDLVFLEFCAAEFDANQQEQTEALYESLIQGIYEINPHADIVFVLTALSSDKGLDVANLYEIPVLDLGTPMSENYNIAGNSKVFTDDGLHPNNMGYELYAKLTKNLLEKYIILTQPKNPEYTEKVLPEALN